MKPKRLTSEIRDLDAGSVPVTSDPVTRQLRRFFIAYYREQGRPFAWREPGVSPFGILVVEMLLRQTNAERVEPVWRAFVERYPTPDRCSLAEEADLYSLIAPLGLGRQRMAALLETSRALSSQYRGRVPSSVTQLLALPHVGRYAAHAVACFAFGRRLPVVDVNVLRVLGRIYGHSFPSDNRRAPAAWEIAAQILPRRGTVKEHNWGLLDFSAAVCTAKAPVHSACDLREVCCHYQSSLDTKPPHGLQHR